MRALMRIWMNPRETIAELAKTKPHYLFVPLAMAYGIAMNLNKVLQGGASPELGLSHLEVVGANILFGGLYGICMLFAASYPLSWIGRFLGGSSRPRQVRTVLAWASVPYLPLLAMLLVLAVLGPSELLVRSHGTPFEVVGASPWFIGLLIYFLAWGVLSVWLCVIGVIGLSEVHGFGVGRSIATYAIVIALFTAVVLSLFVLVIGPMVANVR